MAFVINGEDAAGSNKQRLNLSALAYEVISSDMFTFGESNLSGFINTVFEQYYPIADASISRTLNRLQGELSKLLSGIPGDERTKRQVVNRLLTQKKDSLVEKAQAYGRGTALTFWINKKNLEYLTEADSECGEDAFYARRSKYIKSVLEEYARLPFVEREMVYFTPFVEKIRDAIQKEYQLRVVTGTDTVYSVYPVEILCDPLSTANYLVGYCRRYNSLEGEKQPCSFKIAALKSIKGEKSKSAFLKIIERKQLAQKIGSRGVQFLVGNETEILVRLTDAGIYKYQRQVHLRPGLIEKKGRNIFVFQCTEAQAEFYFFKFGKDAEIISPLSLREKLMSMYESAASIYAKTKEEK